MKTRIALFVLVALTLCVGQRVEKYICKVNHLGPYAISVNCLNGADATGTKIGDTLVISCADMSKEKK